MLNLRETTVDQHLIHFAFPTISMQTFTYPDSVNLVKPPNTTIPKTLTALPNNQYATDLSLTCGKLDFPFVAPPSWAPFATVDDHADFLKLCENSCLVCEFRIVGLSLRPVRAKDRPANCLRNGDLVA